MAKNKKICKICNWWRFVAKHRPVGLFASGYKTGHGSCYGLPTTLLDVREDHYCSLWKEKHDEEENQKEDQ